MHRSEESLASLRYHLQGVLMPVKARVVELHTELERTAQQWKLPWEDLEELSEEEDEEEGEILVG